MLELAVPGFRRLRLAHLVLDFNGTLAVGGRLLPSVKPRLAWLRRTLRIHVLTADTFGRARKELRGVRCELTILANGGEDRAKAAYVRRLGASSCACIGNGRNDRLMLRQAALGICAMQAEGAATAAFLESDLVVLDICDALDLLADPSRLIATLRA